MGILHPFRAYRPRPEGAGDVACPPYDVLSEAEARALGAGRPDCFVHVTRPEIGLDVDDHDERVYAAGRQNLYALIGRGVLRRDAREHLYVYGQRQGRHRQVGIVACTSVAAYITGRIKRHERTRPDEEDDRTRHILAQRAHAEPVFLTYRASAIVDEAVERICAAEPALELETPDGVHHQLWVPDGDRCHALGQIFDEQVQELYVADGHHRSAAAARVHEALADQAGDHDRFLAVVFPHDQMNILPYNRVVTDPKGRSVDVLLAKLREHLDVQTTEDPTPDAHGVFGLYLGGRWYRAAAMPGSFDPVDPVARLDCQLCQDQILAPVFGVEDPRRDPHVDFVGGSAGLAELERRVDEGRSTMAILLHPTEMTEVMEVSDAGGFMPPKSTWFEPKLASGLFVHVFGEVPS